MDGLQDGGLVWRKKTYHKNLFSPFEWRRWPLALAGGPQGLATAGDAGDRWWSLPVAGQFAGFLVCGTKEGLGLLFFVKFLKSRLIFPSSMMMGLLWLASLAYCGWVGGLRFPQGKFHLRIAVFAADL